MLHDHISLLPPGSDGPTARGASSGFPADLLSQSAGRLRILALLYAFVFLMAGVVPALLLPADRARFLENFVHWGPSVIGIVGAVIVAAADSHLVPGRRQVDHSREWIIERTNAQNRK